MIDLASIDFIGTLVAALLTIMVLSYLVADNILFRLATYLFIGVAAGYAGAIAWHNVLRPGLVDPLLRDGFAALLEPATIVTLIIPWALILLLFFKLSPTTSRLGSLPLALLVGVGAAVVVGGAVTGTLIPQSIAAMETLDPAVQAPLTGETGVERLINVLIVLMGTISTLLYFRFTARRKASGLADRSKLLEGFAYIGRIFISITFGVMYAGALIATLIVLTERIQFLWDVFSLFLKG